MTRRVVVVGADAAGMSTASQALRQAGRDALEVMAFERGHHVSYSACGIPYWVSGEVDGPEALIARSAARHRENGIDLRLRTEVTEIDLDSRKLTVAPLDGGVSYQVGLDDGTALLAGLARRPHRAVVVGGGYIGIEMAEAMVRRGLDVTLVDQSPEPMTTLDPDMGALVRETMVRMGITVLIGTPVSGFETGADGRVTRACAAVARRARAGCRFG